MPVGRYKSVPDYFFQSILHHIFWISKSYLVPRSPRKMSRFLDEIPVKRQSWLFRGENWNWREKSPDKLKERHISVDDIDEYNAVADSLHVDQCRRYSSIQIQKNDRLQYQSPKSIDLSTSIQLWVTDCRTSISIGSQNRRISSSFVRADVNIRRFGQSTGIKVCQSRRLSTVVLRSVFGNYGSRKWNTHFL